MSSETSQNQANSSTILQNLNNRIYDDPYYLTSSDNPTMQLVSTLFNGNNYLNWSRGVKRSLMAKNKLVFITGKLKKPSEDSADHKKWIQCDFMVFSWILKSIAGNLSQGFMYVHTSKQLWDDICERDGQSNGAQYFQLQKDLYNLQQGNMNIAQYYGSMKQIWEDLQEIEGFPECQCGALNNCTCQLLKRVLEADNRRKLVQFLLGVDHVYVHLTDTLLSQDPLPPVN